MQTFSLSQKLSRNLSKKSSKRTSAFTSLLMRYMDGQIADRSWKQIMKTFDQGGLSTTERMAFARYMNEVIDDGSSIDLHVPMPEETEELMSQIRA